MIRRIKSCQSCRKRFTTGSGAILCLSCRKDDTTMDRNYFTLSSNIDCTDRPTMEDNSTCIPLGITNESDNTGDGEIPAKIPSFDNIASGGESTKESNTGATSEILKLGTCDEHKVSLNASVSPCSPTRTANQPESMDSLHDGYATSNIAYFQRKRCGESVDTHDGYKKIKVSAPDDGINNYTSESHDFTQCDHAQDSTKCNEFIPSKIDGGTSQIHSSNRMYQKESVTSDESTDYNGSERGHGLAPHSREGESSVHKDDGCNVSEDDESEILCWDASEPEPFCLGESNFDYYEGECTTPDVRHHSGPCISTNNAMEKISHHSENGEQSVEESPKRDVCYICGSDLSKLSTGIRGRVAHMKRCSAKHGIMSSSKDADFGLDFDGLVEDERVELPPSRPSNGNSGKAIFNPYAKDQWHGDASIDLDTNKLLWDVEPNALMKSKPQQTLLDRFLKAPVRSLTNVLMAGSRNLAKSKAIAEKKKSDSSNGSKPRGRWGGSGWANKQNTGNCPVYKKIPGTDFICDGFLYASHSLSNNYFLTHFHSDHYGGITKQWNEGTIYCSVSTANLVHQQLGVEKRFLHPLPMNTPTVVASKDKPITVTLLDANHCPGAVMFIFEIG
eukprot:CCRYP_011407-RA/>CCRYP_011407-RA protein AED:0.03 eAED:0.03 QI:270/1/1/1/0.66/0.5/4/792/616